MENASFYHLSGIISSILVSISLIGIIVQLRMIWRRKKQYVQGQLGNETPTSILSLNRFFTSFLAFFAVYLYGLTLSHFDHYLVWPRILAMSLVLWILFEIMVDRRTKRSIFLFFSAVFLVCLSIALGVTSYRSMVFFIGVPHLILLIALALYVQGSAHQIYIIRKNGHTGALSKQMHQLFLLKDSSSLIYGASMGASLAWPLILFYIGAFLSQVITLMQFRWVKLSKVAAIRRESIKSDSYSAQES